MDCNIQVYIILHLAYSSGIPPPVAQVGKNNDKPEPTTRNTTAWKATRQRRLAKKITNPHHQKAIQQHGKQPGNAGW
ncbi:MAG: hypothetical protein NC335_09225, partial [Bacteroides sp.]|nr:hypothetical protein [Bacteroides sp.]